MKNRYKAGADFERRVCDWYEEQGSDTIRSAGSHGVVDVLAVLHGLWIANTLRITPYWSPVEKEQFEMWCKRNKCVGRYVWRGDKHDNFKIHFAEVK